MRGFIVNIIDWFSRYLEDTLFRIILKPTEYFSLTNLFAFFEINAWPFPPKNFTIFTQKTKPVDERKHTGVYCQYYRLGFWISRRHIFRIHFKTNGLLFSDKSFCSFEIHGWLLPPKNFTILTQKIKPVK